MVKHNIFEYTDSLHRMDHIPAILKQGVAEGPIPDVSILMPVYNHPHFFKHALDSALAQDYKGDFNIIVLDNNMDDDVNNVNEFEDYVIEKKDARILYYKNEKNILGNNNYNRLPQLAKAEYFVYLHDDDELCPNCLTELLKAKEKYLTTTELIIPRVIPIDKDSKRIGKDKLNRARDLWGRDYRISKFDWFLGSYTNGGGVLHHRESFLKQGGYNEENAPSADYALYTAYAYKHGSIYLNKPLFRYRWAENDSMIVYEKCANRDVQFRTDMLPYIKFPNWLLKIYINNSYQLRVGESDIKFKGKTERPVTLKNKMINYFFILVKLFEHII